MYASIQNEIIECTLPIKLNVTDEKDRFSRIQEERINEPLSCFRSTDQIYHSNDANFYGSFAHIRKALDYNHHVNYTEKRQSLQDTIIMKMLDTIETNNVHGKNSEHDCSSSTKQWIVFTAGSMGVGKSYTVEQLAKKRRFPLSSFLSVDPDEIRLQLPEFNLFVNTCPNVAGYLTTKEAGYIAEILTMAALEKGKNVLVDGSLRDSNWYQKYFARLRREYTALQIAILYVSAPKEAVLQRAADRAQKTGRVVPREILEMTLEQVPRSLKILGPLADYFCELNNAPGADDIKIMTKGEDWNSFRRQWWRHCDQGEGKRKRKFILFVGINAIISNAFYGRNLVQHTGIK